MFGLGLGLGIHRHSNANPYAFPFISRVESDGGVIRDKAALLNLTYYLQSMMPNTKLLYCPELGVKLRTSGINNYVTKLYDLGPAMLDGAQTTALNQPFLSGNIAPNEKYAIKNPNGGNSYLTHTPINFAATDKWSVTTVINNTGRPGWQFYLGGSAGTAGRIGLTTPETGYKFRFDNNSGEQAVFDKINYSIIGKTIIVTFVANGNNELKVFFNGTLIGTKQIDTQISIDTLLKNTVLSTYQFNGMIPYHCIRDIALSPTQVQDEYNYLRTLFPEIESVQIGTQTWATSNCEMTCTPQGNVIQEMQAATNVERITNVADREFSSDTGFWTKFSDWTISGGAANCSGALTTTYFRANGKVSINKWYKVSVNIVITSGFVNYIPGNAGPIKPLINGLNSFYIFHNGSTGDIVFQGTNNFVGSIDNVSVEEVGWADSTNLYNYVYANTSGTAGQKEYAAVKAASMRCYYNNDPAIGAVYGKLYNWYAVKLLQMDIDYYNAANPTAPWGWRVPTKAHFDNLIAFLGGNSVVGGKMKKEGLNYWDSPNTMVDNSSGYSAIGSGFRDQSGGFAANRRYSSLLSIDGRVNTVTHLNSESSYTILGFVASRGYSLRLIKT